MRGNKGFRCFKLRQGSKISEGANGILIVSDENGLAVVDPSLLLCFVLMISLSMLAETVAVHDILFSPKFSMCPTTGILDHMNAK